MVAKNFIGIRRILSKGDFDINTSNVDMKAGKDGYLSSDETARDQQLAPQLLTGKERETYLPATRGSPVR